MNLTLIQTKTIDAKPQVTENEEDVLKRFLRYVDMKSLFQLKTSRKMPNPFVVKVFQILALLRNEKAEKWSEIQESIKLSSFKIDMWRLSHKRIDQFRLQLLRKLFAECTEQSEKAGELCPLAANLMDWISWLLNKESKRRQIPCASNNVLIAKTEKINPMLCERNVQKFDTLSLNGTRLKKRNLSQTRVFSAIKTIE